MAQYAHRYHRPSGSQIPLNDPKEYIRIAKSRMTNMPSVVQNYPDILRFINDTAIYVERPIDKKFDRSSSAACLLDDPKVIGMSGVSLQDMIDLTNACAEAYNEKPLGPLAFAYAESMHFLAVAKYFSPISRNNTEMLQAALVSKEFFQRAIDDGVRGEQATIGRANNLINAMRQSAALETTIDVGKIVLGVAAVLLVLRSGGGTVGLSAPQAMSASAVREAARLKMMAEEYQFFVWRKNMEAAIALAAKP